MLPKKIIIIGASVVFGRVDPQHGGFAGRLKTWHEKKFTPNAVFNLGISSETSAMLLKRLYLEASIRKPDLIIVSVGLNDTKIEGSLQGEQTTPIKQFEENIKEIIRESRKLCDIAFVSITPIDESKTTPLSYQKNFYILLKDVVRYADITKNICIQEKVPYLDVMNTWLQIDYKTLLYEDGMHPNSLGHKDIFLKLKAFLKKHHSSVDN